MFSARQSGIWTQSRGGGGGGEMHPTVTGYEESISISRILLLD